MKNKAILIFSVLILLFFVSCDKDEARIPDFLVEFATVVKTGSTIAIKLDNGKVLKAENTSSVDLKNDDRVIVNYTPIENHSIIINSIQQIFLGEIKSKESPNDLKTDPVKIISIWVSGKYLNMSIQVDYHSKAHSVGLFRDMQANKPTLYFMYSREDDPEGAPTRRYLSFDLESLQKEKDFTICINTYKGERKFNFMVKKDTILQH